MDSSPSWARACGVVRGLPFPAHVWLCVSSDVHFFKDLSNAVAHAVEAARRNTGTGPTSSPPRPTSDILPTASGHSTSSVVGDVASRTCTPPPPRFPSTGHLAGMGASPGAIVSGFDPTPLCSHDLLKQVNIEDDDWSRPVTPRSSPRSGRSSSGPPAQFLSPSTVRTHRVLWSPLWEWHCCFQCVCAGVQGAIEVPRRRRFRRV
jgi:hypothetical protein